MRRTARTFLFASLLFFSISTASAQTRKAKPRPLKAANDELATVWKKLVGPVKKRLASDARSRLSGLKKKKKRFKIHVRRVDRVTVGIDPAPGYRDLGTDRLVLALPVSGSWKLQVKAEVRIWVKIGFIRIRHTFPVTLTVKNLSLEQTFRFDHSDPTRPVVKKVDKPKIDFKVKLRSKKFFTNILLWALSPIGNHLAHKTLKDTLKKLTPALSGLSGLPGPVPGDGTPQLTDSGKATPFGTIVQNVDEKCRQQHLPHGTLLRARMDTPQTDSWEAAYGPGGQGNLGTPVGYEGGADSAIWTGHYLASQAFRYDVTGDPAALENVKHSLSGIGALLDVNGGTGLLARVAAPENSVVGRLIVKRGAFRRATIGGKTWVGRQGGGGISRDQYSGVFFGLVLAHDLVPDPAVRARCAYRIRQMLDYLIRNDWFIDEDRRPFTAGPRSGFPTFWLNIPIQRLCFLLIGKRVAPGVYDTEFRKAAPLVHKAWLSAWSSTFNFQSYYKFNLSHVAYYNYFRLEKNKRRWKEMLRGLRIQRRYVGHHHNPHFNLIQASVEPSLEKTLFPSVRESLRRFVKRNHREAAPATLDLSTIKWTTMQVPEFHKNNWDIGYKKRRIPAEPLDIPLRRYTDFLWQRHPFAPARPGKGNPHMEKSGLDLLLPYWMGKHHGAIK